jgi:hypothetical protein
MKMKLGAKCSPSNRRLYSFVINHNRDFSDETDKNKDPSYGVLIFMAIG